jgi:hypothetical protein
MSHRFRAVLAAAFAVFSVSQASAFEATITRVAPIEAHPTEKVARTDLAPVEGVPVAPPRQPATPYVAEQRPMKVPVPISNPVSVSWCLSDIL